MGSAGDLDSQASLDPINLSRDGRIVAGSLRLRALHYEFTKRNFKSRVFRLLFDLLRALHLGGWFLAIHFHFSEKMDALGLRG